MCDPTMMMMLGTAVQTATQYQSSQYQADVAEQNAKIAEEQARDVQRRKAEEISDLQEQRRQMQGQQRVAMAATGADSGYGSGLAILTDTSYLSQMDINKTEYNAAKEEWGYQSQAKMYKAESGAHKAAAKNAIVQGVVTMGSQMIGAKSGNSSAGASTSKATGYKSSSLMPTTNTYWDPPKYMLGQNLVDTKWYSKKKTYF